MHKYLYISIIKDQSLLVTIVVPEMWSLNEEWLIRLLFVKRHFKNEQPGKAFSINQDINDQLID